MARIPLYSQYDSINKSHAVSYTFMAYQMMYLKVHFPDEFYMVISNTK